MHTILKIISIEKKRSKEGFIYYSTLALLDNQNEVQGWSRTHDEYKEGQEVESYHDDLWDVSKMQKPKSK